MVDYAMLQILEWGMRTTRELVERLRKANPGITQSQMADIVGVSRERIRQILIELGLPTVPERYGAPK